MLEPNKDLKDKCVFKQNSLLHSVVYYLYANPQDELIVRHLTFSLKFYHNLQLNSTKEGSSFDAVPTPLLWPFLVLCTVPHASLTGTWTARDDSGRSHGHPVLLFPITMEEVGVYGEIYGAAEEVLSSSAAPSLDNVSSL